MTEVASSPCPEPEQQRYERGIVYALVSKEDPALQYIGSTVHPLVFRAQLHESAHQAHTTQGRGSRIISFEVLGRGDYDMQELEECLHCTRYELKLRERYHIENNTCVNQRIPTRTRAEYRTTEQFKETLKSKSKQLQRLEGRPSGLHDAQVRRMERKEQHGRRVW
jgi:hypothetical protein